MGTDGGCNVGQHADSDSQADTVKQSLKLFEHAVPIRFASGLDEENFDHLGGRISDSPDQTRSESDLRDEVKIVPPEVEQQARTHPHTAGPLITTWGRHSQLQQVDEDEETHEPPDGCVQDQ